MHVEYDNRNLRELYRDEYANEILPDHLNRDATIEELDCVNSRVWEVTDKGSKFSDANIVRCR